MNDIKIKNVEDIFLIFARRYQHEALKEGCSYLINVDHAFTDKSGNRYFEFNLEKSYSKRNKENSVLEKKDNVIYLKT